MNDNEDTRPNVWITYHDRMKNLESAKKFGELKEMFTGHVYYDTAVELAIKMFQGRYRPGDYLLEIGPPRLVGIVMTVAEKYFSADGTINLLCWSKKNQEYFPETYYFPDEEEEAERTYEHS